MGIGTFFSRLVARHGDEPAPAPAPPTPQAAAEQRDDAHQQRRQAEAILHREEVLDGRNRLYGYRFSLRAGEGEAPLDESAFFSALTTTGIGAFVQRRLAVIPISPEAVAAGRHAELAGPHAVFLLDLRHGALATEAWLGLLQAIRNSGARTGLTGLSSVASAEALLAQTDAVFLDLTEFSLAALPRFAHNLRLTAPGLLLAATGVHSWAERRMCASWSFDWCLGHFAVTPDEEEKESRLDQSRVTVMELLNHLQNDDVTDAELGDVAKRDPNIAFHLLRLANSPAVGLVTSVASLEQAIMVLGRHQLYRWLLVSMFRVGKSRDRDEALLELALSRARFLEAVAVPVLPKAGRDELFLVGLLSLMDLLLAMPMHRILGHLNLGEAVRQVLMDSTGPYARFLMLALAVEKGLTARAVGLANDLGIPAQVMETASIDALRWAEAAMRGESL